MTESTSCPACAAPVAAADRYCESCGAELHPAVIAIAGHAAPGAAGTAVRCVSCDAAEISQDGYCERCGHRQPRGRDHAELDVGLAAGVTDKGHHHHRNEDALVIATAQEPGGTPAVVVVVCDGVSSTPRAADASQAAAEAAAALLIDAVRSGAGAEEATTAAAARAAAAVTALAAAGTAPSCTLVSAVVTEKLVTVGWVGDSRAYWLAAHPVQLTKDDNVAGALVVAAQLSQADAYAGEGAHVLTRWLGADGGTTDPQVVTLTPDAPGAILVCSDGLWNYLPDAGELHAAVPGAADEPLAAARTLVRRALDAGGHDNVTVALIPFSPLSRSNTT